MSWLAVTFTTQEINSLGTSLCRDTFWRPWMKRRQAPPEWFHGSQIFEKERQAVEEKEEKEEDTNRLSPLLMERKIRSRNRLMVSG
jgi:hypothetical protein